MIHTKNVRIRKMYLNDDNIIVSCFFLNDSTTTAVAGDKIITVLVRRTKHKTTRTPGFPPTRHKNQYGAYNSIICISYFCIFVGF